MGKLNLKQSELKVLFFFFLNVTDALENYNAEMIRQNKDDAQKYFKALLKNMVKKPECILISSFSWGKSKKGFDYWNNLNKKWEKQFQCK